MKETLIERQIGILRTILSDLALNKKNGEENFITFTNKYFGFDTDLGWNILMNAFYLFEDTELAKKDFDKFDLQGPSRHENIGEKYLRLYGVLNAFYQQYLALINLMELFKLASKKKFIQQLKESDCIKLRNKIAAHSTNYSTEITGDEFDVYEISRNELKQGRIRLLKNQDTFELYSLNELIISFNKQAEEILSEILRKFLKKKFNNQGKNFKDFEEIEKLRNDYIQFGELAIKIKKN